MDSRNPEIVRPRAFHVGALALVVLLLQPGILPAQTDACVLLKAEDVASLLGGTPTHTSSPQGLVCTWASSRKS